MELIAYIDGGSRGNPGPAAAAVAMRDAASGLPVHEAGYYLGRETNNVAEYMGLIKAIEVAIELGARRLDIRSDSELMVNQILGTYRVKSEKLKPYHEQAQQLLLGLDNWQIQHVRREKNKRADQLVNMALDRKSDVEVSGDELVTDEAIDLASQGEPDGPHWTLTYVGEPSTDCPAPWPAGIRFEFGPETPRGVCVHAARQAFLSEPAAWPAEGNPSATVKCPHCGVAIRIDRT